MTRTTGNELTRLGLGNHESPMYVSYACQRVIEHDQSNTNVNAARNLNEKFSDNLLIQLRSRLVKSIGVDMSSD